MLNRDLLALLLLFSVVGSSQAVVQVTESTDAGNNAATAIVVSDGRSFSVSGTLKAGTGNPFETNPVDVDVYKFTVPADMNVVIEGNSDVCDVNLFLLDGQFRGIQADDDSGGSGYGGFNARIARFLTAGTYYVAIGQNNIGAFPANATAPGTAVWNDDSGVIAPGKASIPISFIGADDATPAPTNGEAYQLSLSYQQFFTPTLTNTTATLNRQTGLYELTVDVTNTSASDTNGFRLFVDISSYLTSFPSLKLQNATSSAPVYIDYPYPVKAGAKVPVRLSFYTSNRSFPTTLNPVLDVAPLAASQTAQPNAPGVQVDRVLALNPGPNQTILLEFPSVVGRWYRISYSSNDMSHWFYSAIPLQATGSRTQWIDSGAPLTDSPPAPPNVTSRFYKVSEIVTP